jgi:hypothetical protein
LVKNQKGVGNKLSWPRRIETFSGETLPEFRLRFDVGYDWTNTVNLHGRKYVHRKVILINLGGNFFWMYVWYTRSFIQYWYIYIYITISTRSHQKQTTRSQYAASQAEEKTPACRNLEKEIVDK